MNNLEKLMAELRSKESELRLMNKKLKKVMEENNEKDKILQKLKNREQMAQKTIRSMESKHKEKELNCERQLAEARNTNKELQKKLQGVGATISEKRRYEDLMKRYKQMKSQKENLEQRNKQLAKENRIKSKKLEELIKDKISQDWRLQKIVSSSLANHFHANQLQKKIKEYENRDNSANVPADQPRHNGPEEKVGPIHEDNDDAGSPHGENIPPNGDGDNDDEGSGSDRENIPPNGDEDNDEGNGSDWENIPPNEDGSSENPSQPPASNDALIDKEYGGDSPPASPNETNDKEGASSAQASGGKNLPGPSTSRQASMPKKKHVSYSSSTKENEYRNLSPTPSTSRQALKENERRGFYPNLSSTNRSPFQGPSDNFGFGSPRRDNKESRPVKIQRFSPSSHDLMLKAQIQQLLSPFPSPRSDLMQSPGHEMKYVIPKKKHHTHGRKPEDKTTKGKKIFRCMCGGTWNKAKDLDRHLYYKVRGCFYCDFPFCFRTFYCPTDARIHKIKAHGGHNQFACGGCKGFFESKNALKIHQKETHCKTERLYQGEGYHSIWEPVNPELEINYESVDEEELEPECEDDDE